VCLIGHSYEEPTSDESFEAIRQEPAGDAEVLLPLFEPPHSEKCIAEDEEHPAITNDVQRSGD